MTNEGVLTNRGIELILNTVPVRTSEWVVRSGINLARNRNKVVSLGGDADTYLLADIWGLNGPAMILREGDDYGTISGYDYIYDDNGNRVVNDAGTKYLITDTRAPIGNASPDFIAGWNTSVTWKNFMLTTLIDTKWGGDIYAGSYVIGLQTGQSPETLVEREGGGLLQIHAQRRWMGKICFYPRHSRKHLGENARNISFILSACKISGQNKNFPGFDIVAHRTRPVLHLHHPARQNKSRRHHGRR